MRALQSIAALFWLFGSVYAKKGSKTCATKFCCTAVEDGDLTIRFLLTFESSLPSPLCTSTQRELEYDFVISYNTLARQNCDKPCFRRAKDAHIVAAPPNTFVSCGTDESDKDSDYGYRERSLAATDGGDTIIIQVELEQAGACTTALDGQKGVGTPAYYDDYEDACGIPPWASGYGYEENVCHPSSDYDETCCCVCGTDRSLGEWDLTKVHRSSHTLSALELYLLSVQELFGRDDCSGLAVDFERNLLLSFTGSTSELTPSDSDGLFAIVSGGYNERTFENCDELGRTIVDGFLEPVESDPLTRRRLQRGGRYVNSYSSRNCSGRACAASRIDVRAACSLLCPQQDDLEIFEGFRRRLHSDEQEETNDVRIDVEDNPTNKRHDLVGIERVLSGEIPITSTARDFIAQECLCLTHDDASTGTAPTADEYVAQINSDVQANGQFSDLGELAEAVELVIIPTAGPPKDIVFWLPIYVRGFPCNLDYKELQALADVVQTSYNDIVVEDCDKPLFRQILSGVTWMDPRLNCNRAEFVVHIKVSFRCHGHCPKKHPLFGGYEDQYYRLLHEEEIEGGEDGLQYDPFQYSPEIENREPVEVPIHQTDQDVRREEEWASPEEDPGEGICFLEGSRHPMPPTRHGMEDRINADLTIDDITSVQILTEPLCRCEGPYEHFYMGNGPKVFQHFGTINGIFVVPNEFKSCKYHRRLGEQRELAFAALPCHSFFK